MSWADYITNMKVQGISQCGIFVKDTGTPCAQSEGFNVTPQEVVMMRNCIAGSDSKLEVGGSSCVMTGKDDACVKGKTKAANADGSKTFFHCEATEQYIVIAGMSGAGERKASEVSNKIAAYLRSLGQ